MLYLLIVRFAVPWVSTRYIKISQFKSDENDNDVREAVTGFILAVIVQLVANTKFKNVVLAICMQNIALKIYHVLQLKKSFHW